jgi:hypothetical protein
MPNVAKLLLFPKPAPPQIHRVEHAITLSIGSERYAITIQAKIERVTTRPMDKSSPEFQHGRELEFYKPAPQGGDPDADRTSGPAEGSAAEAITAGAKFETLPNTPATAPVATVGPQAPDVAPRAGKASKKASRSEKPLPAKPRQGGV